MDVQVKAPQTQTVDVSLALATTRDAAYETVKAETERAVRAYFTGARLSKGALLSELYALLHEVEGLANYRVLAPAEDVAAQTTVLPVLGTLSISALS